METDLILQALQPAFALKDMLGVAVRRQGELAFNSLPFARPQTEQLTAHTAAIFEGYREAGREIRYVLFHWKEINILIRRSGEIEYAMVFSSMSSADAVVSILPVVDEGLASTLQQSLASQRKVVRIRLLPWKPSLDALERALSKVVSDSQARKMVERHMADQRIDLTKPVIPERVKQFADGVLDGITHKTKQKLLKSEFEEFLQQLG